MKVNKKKFLISILAISTIAIGSSTAIGLASTSQTKDNTNNVTSDSINTYTSVPMPGPTMDEPIVNSGGGNNGSVVTTEYEIDWSKKESPISSVIFDGDFAYTNSSKTTLLGMDPNTKSTIVKIPSSVKEIKGYTKVTNTKENKQFAGAFEGITKITSVTIEGTNVKIDANSFKDCTSLKTVIVNNNAIRTIGKSAFENCTSLNTITLSSSLTTIEENAFKNTTSLTKISLPSNLKTIGDSAFEGSSLTSVDMRSTKVVTIGNSAFKDTINLSSVDFARTIQNIGISSFENSSINKVILTSSSLPNIGASSFKDCKNLTEFKSTAKKSNLKDIPQSIFESCVNLSNVQFSQSSSVISFKSIGDNAFKGTKINTLNISGVGTIGASAFENCKELTSLTGQSVLQFINNNAFMNSGLKVISSARSITNYTDTNLLNIVKIGDNAFNGTKIINFKSGNNLTTIGDGSFKNIDTLKHVDFSSSKNLTRNDDAFDQSDLSKVKWPNNRVFRGNKIIF